MHGQKIQHRYIHLSFPSIGTVGTYASGLYPIESFCGKLWNAIFYERQAKGDRAKLVQVITSSLPSGF